MRIIKYIFYIILILLALYMIFGDRVKLYRFIVYNISNITDYEIFPNRPLQASATFFQFQDGTAANEVPDDIIDHHPSLDTFLEKTKTVAFLIIRNDTILYEKYFQQYQKNSIVASFSMAKSITSLLIGAAIEDRLIDSEEDLIQKYLPNMNQPGMEKVTIKHVLQMTSGIDFNESYFNPFGEAASFYYGVNLREQTENLTLKYTPGTHFEYTSGNTQILGLILEKVLAPRTITAYLQEKLWTPLQMEYDASWSIDQVENGIEKTFCCINARAIDFAKIGRLMLRKGEWNGQQIIPLSWIDKSTTVDRSEGGVDHYKYQWWLPTTTGDFCAQGHLGQYIYVNPMKQLIIVRLGSSKAELDWKEVFVQMAQKM